MSQFFVVYDAIGAVVTRYDAAIHAALIDQPPAGLSLLPVDNYAAWMATASGGWRVINGQLIAPPAPTSADLLAIAQQAKINSLSTACRAQIEAGFDSAALGAMHHYPAGQQDQANLTASVTASLVPNLPAGWTTAFWCADSSGVWTYAEHTAAQIQQAGLDGKAAITAALQRNAALRAQVEAATTLTEVAAVMW